MNTSLVDDRMVNLLREATPKAGVPAMQTCRGCTYWRPGMVGNSCRCVESKYYTLRTLGGFSCYEGKANR